MASWPAPSTATTSEPGKLRIAWRTWYVISVCGKNTSVVSCIRKFLCQLVATKKAGENLLTYRFKKKHRRHVCFG